MKYKQPATECQYCGLKFRAGGEKQMYRMLAHENAHVSASRAASYRGADPLEALHEPLEDD